MISELMPRGYDNMFFALFGITNRAVSTDSALIQFGFVVTN
jgi:MFS-type transporter involved in bile tolerance (Atg22 family)